jgi:hypothetical protein
LAAAVAEMAPQVLAAQEYFTFFTRR